jgi:hypothetical protein
VAARDFFEEKTGGDRERELHYLQT